MLFRSAYEGLRFAKFGLIIRADRAVTLEIVNVQPGDAVMAWTPLEDPDRPATRIDVGPCPGDGNDWIVFSGGLWVSDDPTCVTLAVTTGGHTEQVRLGVEAPLPMTLDAIELLSHSRCSDQLVHDEGHSGGNVTSAVHIGLLGCDAGPRPWTCPRRVGLPFRDHAAST